VRVLEWIVLNEEEEETAVSGKAVRSRSDERRYLCVEARLERTDAVEGIMMVCKLSRPGTYREMSEQEIRWIPLGKLECIEVKI